MSRRAAYWVAFTAAMAVYLVMVLWTLPAISVAAGGLAPFDLRPQGYSAQEARDFLAALGDPGRAIYQGPQRILDLIYPALLAIVLAGAVWALVEIRVVRLLLGAAIAIGMFADYAENVLVAGLLDHVGPLPDSAVLAASRATVIKSGLTGLAMGVVIIALARAGFRKWRTR